MMEYDGDECRERTCDDNVDADKQKGLDLCWGWVDRNGIYKADDCRLNMRDLLHMIAQEFRELQK